MSRTKRILYDKESILYDKEYIIRFNTATKAPGPFAERPDCQDVVISGNLLE